MTARRIFFAAGIVGILFVLPMYFMEGRIDAGAPIAHPEYYYGFIGVTLVWQLLFLVIGRNPIKYRPIMPIAILEKVSYGLAMPMLFASHRVSGFIFFTGLVDIVWAVLFGIAFGKTHGSADHPISSAGADRVSGLRP
jgi:hypothetical protein